MQKEKYEVVIYESGTIAIKSKIGGDILHVYGPKNSLNYETDRMRLAEFFCHTANAHAEMVEVLKDLVLFQNTENIEFKKLLKKAEAILAKEPK